MDPNHISNYFNLLSFQTKSLVLLLFTYPKFRINSYILSLLYTLFSQVTHTINPPIMFYSLLFFNFYICFKIFHVLNINIVLLMINIIFVNKFVYIMCLKMGYNTSKNVIICVGELD